MISKLLIAALAVTCAFVAGARTLPAQLGAEGLVTQVDEINFSFSCWNPHGALRATDSCASGRRGFGLEVLYDIGKIAFPGFDSEVVRRDTVGGTTTCTAAGQCQTTVSFTVVREHVPRRYVELELGLGYRQFGGFGSRDPGMALDGTVRELPAISLYASGVFEDAPLPLRLFSPYVGVHSGLIELHELTALATGANEYTVYSGGGRTFQWGGSLGLALTIPNLPVYLFADVAMSWRRFPSVQWSTAGTNQIPQSLPRSLDFGGASSNIGVQVSLPRR